MSWTDQNIVFLISLPRSGSTLVQRILTAHSDVHTSAESWLLLPQFYAVRQGHVFSEYSHTSAAGAIQDFCAQLDNGADDYYRRVGEFAVRLFSDVTPEGPRYYLEKTPRNNLILDELLTAFPRSRLIFLWRNPLACAASVIDTFGKGRWNLYKHVVDFYDGLDNMVRIAAANPGRVHSVRYEDLLLDPEKTITGILEYLDLPEEERLSEQFSSIRLQGRMGDPTGVTRYSSISQEPLAKWKATFNTLARRRWASRYLQWLGEERLSAMGYDPEELRNDLATLKPGIRGLGSDIVRMTYGFLERRLQLKLFRHLYRTRRDTPIPRRYF